MVIRNIINAPSRFVRTLQKTTEHDVNLVQATSMWDYVKKRLGFEKNLKHERKIKARYRDESYMRESEKDPSLHDELWKPGYRGRTENKRF